MPRITAIEKLSLPERHLLRTRHRGDVGRVPEFGGDGFSLLSAHMKAVGGALSDIPYVAFRGQDPADMRLEVCFPLAEAKRGGGDVEAAMLPAGDIVFCMHLGDYEGTMAVHEEMRAWIGARGLPRPEISCEQYFNGLEFPVDQLLTKIFMPLP